MKHLIFCYFLMLVVFCGHSQPSIPAAKADSLFKVWKNENLADTARLKAIFKIAWDGYLFNQPDSAFYYAQLQYNFAKKKNLKKHIAIALNTQGVSFAVRTNYPKAVECFTRSMKIKKARGDQKGVATSLNNIGVIFKNQGEYEKALDYYSRSLKIREKLDNPEVLASTLNNMGIIYYNQGNYAKAIDYYTRSLRIREKSGNQKGIAMSLNNIAGIYANQSNFEKAIDYYKRSLKITEKTGDQKGIANLLNNIGSIYYDRDMFDKALDHYKHSLKIREDIGDQKGIALSLNNIGDYYFDQDNYDKAFEHYNQSLRISEKTGNKKGMAHSLVKIGNIHRLQGNYAQSIKFSKRSLSLAEEVGAANEKRETAHSLWKSYKVQGRYKEALKMYELYISTRDSIESEANQKAVIRQEYKYEYEKQAALDSVEYAKEQKLADATIAQQKAEAAKKDAEIEAKRNQQYALFGGVGLLVIFGGFMYSRFRVTRKQKLIIEKQKEEVDLQKSEAEKQRDLAQQERQEAEHQRELVQEKNTEILDSITYAKRLQDAILPPLHEVQQQFPSAFILFKPKDIVSGDFYWMETIDTHTFLAAADCTGHGVPGAMVSVVCANALNKAVNELGKTNPAEILDVTRDLVIATFAKAGSDVQDGMDISLISVPKGSNSSYDSDHSPVSISWAGANNPLWIVRNDAIEVEVIKADKQPVGLYDDQQPFTSHKVELYQGDQIYMFSDGYPDQFGGEKGKKLKSGAFKKLILSHQQKNMNRQEEILDESFEKWKGDLEQIDDVCVIGVRL